MLDILQLQHNWGEQQVKQMVEELRKEDVMTIYALVICWRDVEQTLIHHCGEINAEIIKHHLDRLNIE